ncbi:MAG: PAP/fibrillin family protein [Treponema sp.]|jgi:hypothetical protein|nr:PAP/fibrillin family protein [Treponema sp.]
MKKFLFLPVIILIFSSIVAAQDRSAQQGFDSSPYVSQIKAESRNNLIRLTWTDSPEARGHVYIFRSALPFSGSVPANIRPVIVRYGTQYYIDDIDDIKNIYYFIAASDVSGQRYDVIIPQTNSIYVNTAQSDMPVQNLSHIALGPADGISNLRASRDGNRVVITFNNAYLQKNAILYRSAQPVRYQQDLINAFIVRSVFDSPAVDFPAPGQNWYYALVYEDEVSSGNIGITPGVNATTSAIVIYAEEQTQAEWSMRPIPLPVLTLDNYAAGGFLPEFSQETPLSQDSANALRDSMLPPKASMELKNPRVFSADTQAPASGEESALFQIVNNHFRIFDWEKTIENLQQYLSLPRSREAELRARFYLGQAMYFTGNYRGALFEFLSFRSYHPVEANIWIEAVLTAMVH